MERNSGNTLKTIAVILGVLGVIAAIVIGISVGNNSYVDGLGFGVFFGIALASLLSALILYGFGTLIDNTVQINARMEKTENQLNEIKALMANDIADEHSAPAKAPSAFTAAPAAAPAAAPESSMEAPAVPAAPAPVEEREPSPVPAEFQSMSTAKDIYLHFMKINDNSESAAIMLNMLKSISVREENGYDYSKNNAISILKAYYKHGCRIFEVDRSGMSFNCPECGNKLFSDRKSCHHCGALFRD